MKWLFSVIERILIVFWALAFMQLPIFMNAYQHQLIGHIHQLQWEVNAMNNAASKSHKTIEQYLLKFLKNSDADFSNQGNIMQEVLHRWNLYTADLNALRKVSPIFRPFIFLYHVRFDIAKSTMESFEPGLVLSFEGILYGFAGMAFGAAVFSAMAMALTRLARRRTAMD